MGERPDTGEPEEDSTATGERDKRRVGMGEIDGNELLLQLCLHLFT